MRALLVLIVTAAMVAGVMPSAVAAFDNAVALQQQQAHCINELIIVGVERSDIITNANGCSIR